MRTKIKTILLLVLKDYTCTLVHMLNDVPFEKHVVNMIDIECFIY